MTSLMRVLFLVLGTTFVANTAAAQDTASQAREKFLAAQRAAIEDPDDRAKLDAYLALLGRFGDDYVVEGDIRMSEEEIERHLRRLKASDPGENPGGELVVEVHDGEASYWKDPASRTLSYAVERATFPDQQKYQIVVDGLIAATETWENACPSCGIDFVHRPEHDGNPSHDNVRFIVRFTQPRNEQERGYFALAFYPSDPVPDRYIHIFPTFYGNQVYGTKAILMHELGHVLGYRHEHAVNRNSGCFFYMLGENREDPTYEALTDLDPQSIMHYLCGEKEDFPATLTPIDIEGHKKLYGGVTLDIDVATSDIADALGEVITNLDDRGLLDQSNLRSIKVEAGETVESVLRQYFKVPGVTEKLEAALKKINPGIDFHRMQPGDVIKFPTTLSVRPSRRMFSPDEFEQYKQQAEFLPYSLVPKLEESGEVLSKSLLRVRKAGDVVGSGFLANGFDGIQYAVTSTRSLDDRSLIVTMGAPNCTELPADITVSLAAIGDPSAPAPAGGSRGLTTQNCAYHLGGNVSLVPVMNKLDAEHVTSLKPRPTFKGEWLSSIGLGSDINSFPAPLQAPTMVTGLGQVQEEVRENTPLSLKLDVDPALVDSMHQLKGSPAYDASGIAIGIISDIRASHANPNGMVQADIQVTPFNALPELENFLPDAYYFDPTAATQYKQWGYNIKVNTLDTYKADLARNELNQLDGELGVRAYAAPTMATSGGLRFAKREPREYLKACQRAAGVEGESSYARLLPWIEDWPPMDLPDTCKETKNWPDIFLVDQPVFPHEELRRDDAWSVAYWSSKLKALRLEDVRKAFMGNPHTNGIDLAGDPFKPVGASSAQQCRYRDFKKEIDHGTYLAGMIASSNGTPGFSGIISGQRIISIDHRLATDDFKDMIQRMINRDLDLSTPERIMVYPGSFPSEALSESDTAPPVGALKPNYPKRYVTGKQLNGSTLRHEHRLNKMLRMDTDALWIVAAGQDNRESGDVDPIPLGPKTPLAPQNFGDLGNVVVVTACEDCSENSAKLWKRANFPDENAPRAVTLAAPGFKVPGPVVGGQYTEASGTSASTAFVGAVASAMHSCYPDFFKNAPSRIKYHLVLTGKPYFSKKWIDDETGAPREKTLDYVVVDPRMALRDLSKSWHTIWPDGAGKPEKAQAITPEGWCMNELPVEDDRGNDDTIKVEKILRLQRVKDQKWVVFKREGGVKIAGPYKIRLEGAQPKLLKTDNGDVKLNNLYNLYLNRPRMATSCG